MDRSEKSAFGILYNPDSGRVLLHKRDEQAPINPNMWGLFGGAVESGEEPLQAWFRELHEELGITSPPPQVRRLADYVTDRGTHRFVYLMPLRLRKGEMRLGEGEDFDWLAIDDAFNLALTSSTKKDLELFGELLRLSPSLLR